MIYVLIAMSSWNATYVSFQEFNSLKACREAATEIRRQAGAMPRYRDSALRMSCVKKGDR